MQLYAPGAGMSTGAPGRGLSGDLTPAADTPARGKRMPYARAVTTALSACADGRATWVAPASV